MSAGIALGAQRAIRVRPSSPPSMHANAFCGGVCWRFGSPSSAMFMMSPRSPVGPGIASAHPVLATDSIVPDRFATREPRLLETLDRQPATFDSRS